MIDVYREGVHADEQTRASLVRLNRAAVRILKATAPKNLALASR